MGLLEILTQNGSILTQQDGTTPPGFDQNTSVLNSATLLGSTLDIDGQTPQQYDVNSDPILVSSLLQTNLDGYNGQTPQSYQNQVLLGTNMLVNTTLPGSLLDLEGQLPTQYINNLPG
jgi:hypothetical protein